ncbi:MAG: 4'-phosphopantetheinyl transferase superfamily protein [Eubacterium sp.]|nr:4'-phosphopantetheinyl transferase superfamily protein [Eubacterium sp.]
MTDCSGKQMPPYEPVHLDNIRIVLWETGSSGKKTREKPAEDMRLLYALGRILERDGTTGGDQMEMSEMTDIKQNTSETVFRKAGDHLEPSEWICERTERGKPYFVHHPEVCFSLSDSEGMTAAAFAAEPVGLDIQLHRRHGIQRPEKEENERLSRMARRFFHPDERDFVLACEAGIRQRFYRVWTAKEAYVKYTGQGIDGEFTKISVIPEPETASIPAQLTCRQHIRQFVTWQACGCRFYYREPEEGLSLCLSTRMKTTVTVDFC